VNFDQRYGAIISVVMHLVILAGCALIFRQPLTQVIIAAGEGSGEGVIEVGVVEASQLSQFGLSLPKQVSLTGDLENAPNNESIKTAPTEPPPDAEIIPSDNKRQPKTKDKTTDRPTDNRTDRLFSKEPLRGSSTDKNIEIGRTSGSQVPSMVRGVGVGSGANLGANGVPGGSDYGRRLQSILSRNFNPPTVNDVTGPQYVIVHLRIARDGRILSLSGGRLTPVYFKRRSTNELINNAAERAVLAAQVDGLPPFPNGFLIGAQEAVAEVWFRYPK
jgi:TonB C terminal